MPVLLDSQIQEARDVIERLEQAAGEVDDLQATMRRAGDGARVQALAVVLFRLDESRRIVERLFR